MTQSVEQRLDGISAKLAQINAQIRGGARTMGIVGVIALLLLSGYFYYGYREIRPVLEPAELVPMGAQMVTNNLPAARDAVVAQVSASAPMWAEQVSVKLRDEIPGLRVKMQEHFLAESKRMMDEAVQVSAEKLKKAFEENHDQIEQGFKELAEHEELSESSLAALVAALEVQMQQDLKDQSAIVLDSVQHLSARVGRLAKGEGLDEEEQIERQILMLARRLQLTQADPTPIQPPAFTRTAVTPEKPMSDNGAPTDGTVPMSTAGQPAGEPQDLPDGEPAAQSETAAGAGETSSEKTEKTE